MLTCAVCEHYRHQPNDPDLTSRVCYGGPPQVINQPVVVQTPTGPKNGITQVLTRPNPAPTEPACGLFKFRLAFGAPPVIDQEKVP